MSEATAAPSTGAGGFYKATDEQAQRGGGADTLHPPTGALKELQNLKVKEGYKHKSTGHVTNRSYWQERVVIDDISYKVEEPDPAHEDRRVSRDAAGKPVLAHESAILQLRVADKPYVTPSGEKLVSKNAGRKIADFLRWRWDLTKFTQEELDEWKESHEIADDDPRSNYAGWFMNHNMSSGRMRSLCKALKCTDRLVNGTNFKGVSTVFDLRAKWIGKVIVVRLVQGDDKDGTLRDNINGYLEA